jgi:hypothetical protein
MITKGRSCKKIIDPDPGSQKYMDKSGSGSLTMEKHSGQCKFL